MRSEENVAPPDGWRPVVKHCGEWHDTHECPTCLATLPIIPANIELGAE